MVHEKNVLLEDALRLSDKFPALCVTSVRRRRCHHRCRRRLSITSSVHLALADCHALHENHENILSAKVADRPDFRKAHVAFVELREKMSTICEG